MKIQIKAICGEVSIESGDSLLGMDRMIGSSADYQEEDFSDYLDSYYGSVHNAVKGGDMEFTWENDELYVSTTYKLLREITKEEEKQLIEYTQGQWSDGIGEGFEQHPVFNDNTYGKIYVSPWYRGQVAQINPITGISVEQLEAVTRSSFRNYKINSSEDAITEII